MNLPDRDPFDVPQAPPLAPAELADDVLLSLPKRSDSGKRGRIIIFLIIMACVVVTVSYFAFFNEAKSSNTALESSVGAGSRSVGLREDQTKNFELLMTALANDRSSAKTENSAILDSLKRVETNQGAIDKRINKLEAISAELVSRGLVKENNQADAALLPEALQPLIATGIAFCRKAMSENGWYGWAALKGPFTEWAISQSPNLSPDDIKLLHDATQVPREPIPDTHYDIIPSLTRKRIALRIQRDDLSGLVNMVWQDRAVLPPTTPGQYISLAILASRAETASQSSVSTVSDLSVGTQEYQDLQVPRDMRIGFMPCKSTDTIQIVALAIPYLTGGSTIADQDPTIAIYAELRARSIATTFLKRRSERTSSMLSALVEEVQRQERIPRPTVVIPGELDDVTKKFAAQAIVGMVLGRAVREGIAEPARLNTWAEELTASYSQETLAALDLSLTQRAYATLASRDFHSTLLQPTVSESFDRNFHVAVEKYGKELAAGEQQRFLVLSAIQAATAVITYARSHDNPSIESTSAVIISAVRLTAAQVEAQGVARRQIEDEVIPNYLGLYEGATRDWYGSLNKYAEIASTAINESLAFRASEDPTPELVTRLAITGRVEAETAIARQGSIDSVNRDIDSFATSSPLTLIKLARDHAFARVQQAINATITKDVQIRQTYVIAREAIAIAQGKRRVRATSPAPTTTPSSIPLKDPNGGAVGAADEPPPETIQVILTSNQIAPKIKYVTIPAGSYAEARVLAGVVCELGEKTPEPMLINLDYSWSGPAGSSLVMKDLRLVADCTAMGGAPRVRTKITTVSYTLPDNTQITMPCEGWCVDNIQGQAGIVGVWDWNLDTVIPLGTANGLLSALGSLLEPQQQVTSVNTSVTIIDQQQQSPGEKLGKGAAEGLKETVGDHIKNTLENIKPAIFVQNNQPCTVVLKQDVVLPIPADQWDRVVQRHNNIGSSGFVR